jgi:hypothetical protein
MHDGLLHIVIFVIQDIVVELLIHFRTSLSLSRQSMIKHRSVDKGMWARSRNPLVLVVEKAPESMQELDEVSDFETKNHIPLYYEVLQSSL